MKWKQILFENLKRGKVNTKESYHLNVSIVEVSGILQLRVHLMRRTKMMKDRKEKEVTRRKSQILEKIISRRKTLFLKMSVHQMIALVRIQKKK